MNRYMPLSALMMFALTLAGLCLAGCGRSEQPAAAPVAPPVPASVILGELKADRYTNTFFKFTLTVPESWHAQGPKLAPSGDQAATSWTLLSLWPYPQSETDQFNPNLGLFAEYIAGLPDIKTGKDYLTHARKMLETGQLTYTFNDQSRQTDIAGHTFDVLETQLQTTDQPLYQHYYATTQGDFVLAAVLTFANDEQRQLLENTLAQIQFESAATQPGSAAQPETAPASQ